MSIFTAVTMSQLLQTAFLRILRTSRGSRALFSIYGPQSTELSRQSQGKIQPQDALMQSLKSSPSSHDLLSAVTNQLHLMNHKHLVQVLRSLFDLQKSDQKNEDIIRNPTFGSVCHALKRKARALETNEYIEALKVLSYLKVPIDSLIQQTMLQLVRSNINQLNVRQIMFIDFIVSRYDESNPLLDALKLALPLVFQIHLPLELDQDDLPLLKEMLLYSCTRNLPDRCINNIVTGLLLHGQDIDNQTAKSIVWALCDVNMTVDIYPTRVQLFQVCTKILAKSMHMLSHNEVLRLAARLKPRIVEKHLEFYDEELFDAMANYVVDKSEDFDKSMLIARILCKIGHTNFRLMEYLCKLAYEDLSVITQARPNILFAFVNCLSNANYIPKQSQWDAIRQEISRNSVMEMTNVALPWTKFCLELASLGHYDLKLLSKFFSKDTMDTYLSREDSILDYMQILWLHEAAKVFCPGYELSPPEQVLQKAVQVYTGHTGNSFLEDALTRGLGGEEYYASNVQLPSGLVTDYIVSFQRGGHPVSIKANKEGKTSLDQLNLPEMALVVCIIKFKKICYSMNVDQLRGSFRLLVEIVERQGYPVVPVNLHSWIHMPASERGPYLMREIQYKCNEFGRNFNVVSNTNV